MKPKIVVIATHPIQHFCPMYSNLVKKIDWEIKVFFGSKAGIKRTYDDKFGMDLKWDINLDFPYIFLNDGKNINIDKNLYAHDLVNHLRKFNPNVLILYGLANKLQRRAFFWGIINKKKILMIRDSTLRGPKSIFKVLKRRFILPIVFNKIDGFLSVGDANEEFYKKYGVPSTKIFRMPFPIDANYFLYCYKKKEDIRLNIKEKYGIPNNNFIITVIGKFIKIKSQISLIKLFKNIDKKIKNLTLIIIGAGPNEEFLKREAKKITNNNVIFTGFVQPQELPKFLLITDVYIHPSEVDAHPLAISEAIFMGCPIIVSDNCGSYGTTDDVQPGRNGFVYKHNNIESLEYLLFKLINNSVLRKRFSHESIEISRLHQKLAHGEGLKNALYSLNILG